ncbi:demethylmenaquinone methyltransferase [Tuberibacillus sp. Marseille-P3662]|uniref:demethylmenaquinone methyltransferase n=1 Tax=Tuberibacillus sp. Marseille-P3662 TaxID=1965358 RepID=UPI000A1CA78C|nr:demethylmenaquinone methyltransferase [Tuberibacillus sp. Marseille-P3662]
MQPDAKKEKVHHVFQSIYKKYDFMNSLISFNQHKLWRRKAMALLDPQPGREALDVCCGTGDWTYGLSQTLGQDGCVIGLDFSDNMLKVAKQKSEHSSFDNYQFVHGDAMNMPFADNRFDYVTVGFGLRNVPDYLQVLKEMHRVLKPGGRVICLETSQPSIPVYKQLYFFYFKYLMPLLGKVFANSYKEYVWLQESTRHFPNKQVLADLFQQAGFFSVTYDSLTGGIAAIHTGQKSVE